ncbi:MAG: M3 family metallopeptidase [Gammaproteobacteria bacterium]|nr:M3 family metallopeptidase [Gammaproteobacteria bacterium]
MSNPFFAEWDTPFGIPPFDQIKEEHFSHAFDQAFGDHDAEVEAIVENKEAATFENTIEALERTGTLLDKVSGVFFNLTSSNSTDDLQAIELEVVPRFAAHSSRMFNNQGLFGRVKSVYESRDDQPLDADQVQLLADTYTNFVRAGAALSDDSRSKVQALDEELAGLTTQFGQNILKDTNNFELVLDSAEEAKGLPESVLQAALGEGEQRGKSGKYVFTISRSSITPFLQFAEKRDLREKIYKAYTQCGNNDNEHNNHQILKTIAALRARRSRLLGFESHAHYMLDDRMAKTPENVTDLLDKIWSPTRKKVAIEAEDLQSRIQEEGGNFKLCSWDWWYYTEKIRAERYSLNEEQVKQYFKLENVRDGAFDVATRLYGITFEEVTDIPRYHPDVVGYEVKDADGTLIGLFLVDYFMRPSKRGGAWMNEFRGQSNLEESIRPIVVNCCNFPKADPCLLGMDEVRTLFHEFGHGLHGLLSQVRYRSQSGTNVKQDFVELPSQIMEHWAIEPEVMKSYARHVETGEVIPDEIIEKLLESQTFNQGFATTEYLAASYLDMAWHTLVSDEDQDEEQDVESFEEKALQQIDLIDAVEPRYKSSYFQHIFSGDHYSAGYYSYIWAEVLDADGFEAFKEKGIFDAETARSFRENVLERGGTSDPMELYKQFRGREPEVEPLLKNRGLA